MLKRNWINLGAAAAMTFTTLGLATPATARDYYGRYERGDYYRGHDRYRDYRRADQYDYRRGGYYRDQAGYYRGDRYYRCRNDGTTGTIIGAIAGGLIGNSVAGRHGDRTTGTIIGGAVGALAGNAIDKSDSRC